MCDHSDDCTGEETVLIVQRRPSNQQDLCSILAFCKDHERTYIEDYHTLADALKDNRSPVATSRQTVRDLFESGEAEKIGLHFDITL